MIVGISVSIVIIKSVPFHLDSTLIICLIYLPVLRGGAKNCKLKDVCTYLSLGVQSSIINCAS